MEIPVRPKLSTITFDQGQADVSFEEPELHLIVNKGSMNKTIPIEIGDMEPVKISGKITISF